MLRTDRRFWLFAVALSALAGYVDAIGFITLNGLFVSFMSGNSTRLAAGLATDAAGLATVSLLIGCFVAGVVVGVFSASASRRNRAPAVLALVAALLAVAAALHGTGRSTAAACFMAAAMGAENTVFQRDGEVSIGLTYMTGALVKCGQHLAAALAGGPRWGWLPYASLWSGLVGGAVLGATAFLRLGSLSLWAAVAAALVFAALSLRLRPG